MSVEFPDWWIRVHLSNLRNRHYYWFSRDGRRPAKRTWQECFRNNKDKLFYRHGYRKREAGMPLSEWAYCITHQRMKLVRYHDLNYAWRVKEYEVLERMNAHRFQYDNIPSVWKYCSQSQVSKSNKYFRQPWKDKQSRITSWSKCIYRSQKRLMNDSMPEEVTLWDLCYKVNYNKLRRLWQILQWDTCIYDNYNKLKRRSR